MKLKELFNIKKTNTNNSDTIFRFAYEGEKYFRKKEYKKALQFYNKAIEKAEQINNKMFLDMYYSSRAKINIKLKEKQNALIDINKAIELKPETYIYYFERYEIKEALRDEDGAREDLDIVFNILKKNDSEHIFKVYLANQKMKNEEFYEAAQLLKDTDDIKYDNEKINSIKLELYSMLHDDTNLLKAVNKLINIFPQRISYLDLKYNIYLNQKQNKKAIDVLNRILEIEPDNEYYKEIKTKLEQDYNAEAEA